MGKYLLRRLLQGIPTFFGVTLISFLLMMAAPGDPIELITFRPDSKPETAEAMRRQLGLDQPPLVQYAYWLIGNDWTLIDRDGDGELDAYGNRFGILRGDLGRSIVTRQPAVERIKERLPNTLMLMIPAYMLVLVIAISIGIFSALRPYSFLDNVFTTAAFVFYSMPIFIVALALIFIFAVTFRNLGLPHLPIAGMYDNREPQTLGNLLRHMVLPVTALVIIQSAGYMRYIRASMLEVLAADYVRTARSKGLRERRIIFLHVFKNASLPLITLVGFDLPFLLGGAVITEQIFAWPGMGLLFIESLNRGDYSILMGILMLTAVAVVIFQILTDVAYTWVDPRIKLG